MENMRPFRSLCVAIAVLVCLVTQRPGNAQQMRGLAVEGYVTALHLPGGFDVNGSPVVLRPDTTFGLERDRNTTASSPLRSRLQVGAYVWVLGSTEHRTATARSVLFYENWNEKLEGFGPVDKLLSTGAEPVFSADGYAIRIQPDTQVKFQGQAQSLADVGPGTWLRYEGRRDPNGVLTATHASFLTVKPKPVKVVDGAEDFKLQLEPPDLDALKNGRVMLGLTHKWYSIPADLALQQRVARIGMSLVPAFQRNLRDGDPFKIKFAFYAVDDSKLSGIVCSPRGGIVLIPRHLVERLRDDNQLAAVLAMAVAAVTQRQGVNIFLKQGLLVAQELSAIALLATGTPTAGISLAVESAIDRPDGQIVRLEEQRWRIALALMADAGYDPWAAPEAVRLLAAKELPKDPNTLRYPYLSGYLLGILNLQYPKPATDAQAALR
jgi:hypothetical protein